MSTSTSHNVSFNVPTVRKCSSSVNGCTRTLRRASVVGVCDLITKACCIVRVPEWRDVSGSCCRMMTECRKFMQKADVTLGLKMYQRSRPWSWSLLNIYFYVVVGVFVVVNRNESATQPLDHSWNWSVCLQVWDQIFVTDSSHLWFVFKSTCELFGRFVLKL